MNDLAKSVLKTVIYFDIFDYPLSLMEVWKWLITNKLRINYELTETNLRIYEYKLLDIEAALGNMSDKIKQKNGFYFLSGRENLVELRLKKYLLAEAKYKRAIKFVKILRFIPFVEMIAVCNKLAYSNSNAQGDIDLLVIARPARLWLARLLVIGYLKILNVRPKENIKANAIDVSFFISSADLNLQSLQMDQADFMYAYWVSQLVPLFQVNQAYAKFWQANNWIKNYLPNVLPYGLNDNRAVSENLGTKFMRGLLDFIFNWNWLENLAKKFQLKIMPKDLLAMAGQSTRVMINDSMLKFHRDFKREENNKIFNQKLKAYEIS